MDLKVRYILGVRVPFFAPFAEKRKHVAPPSPKQPATAKVAAHDRTFHKMSHQLPLGEHDQPLPPPEHAAAALPAAPSRPPPPPRDDDCAVGVDELASEDDIGSDDTEVARGSSRGSMRKGGTGAPVGNIGYFGVLGFDPGDVEEAEDVERRSPVVEAALAAGDEGACSRRGGLQGSAGAASTVAAGRLPSRSHVPSHPPLALALSSLQPRRAPRGRHGALPGGALHGGRGLSVPGGPP